MTEPNPTNNGSAPPEVAQSTRQAAINRMIARKLQASIKPGPGRVIGQRNTPSQNDAPEYYTEGAGRAR
jgi:hypothetical protein